MKIAIRKYLGAALISQEFVEGEYEDLMHLPEQHMLEMAHGKIDLVEVEFLDDPNPNSRFFRIGTNTLRMRDPWKLDDPSQPGPSRFIDSGKKD